MNNIYDIATQLQGRKRPIQLQSAWSDPQSADGQWSAPTNAANYFYRKDLTNSEMPLYNPMEGYQWQQDTWGGPNDEQYYRYYQSPLEGAPSAPVTPQQQFGQQVQQDPMAGQTGARQLGPGLLGGMGQAAGGLLGGQRPPIEQFANPVSPYNYMPLMPSIPANPMIDSNIGGQQVQHNIPFLSQMYPSQMGYDYQNTIPPDMNPYDYGQQQQQQAPAASFNPFGQQRLSEFMQAYQPQSEENLWSWGR